MYTEINEPPRKQLKLKLKRVVVEEENQICLPGSKKLKLKLPKNAVQPEFAQKAVVYKITPKTSAQPEIVGGKKANIHPEDKDDDDDFVTPTPPKAILKTPQPKRTHREISRNKSSKEPEAQLENQYYEFTCKKILPRIAPSNLINSFATFNDDQKKTVN
ncbi:hypothetical protein L1987_63934 [Smallanthus sonchifolius]|uniref:Uncharacterized protein n=1 Tax=Smallanthus sonchifolius TaxID=185202 RepID=A0ACB9CEN1_9ASTR|nr:hypothetical protein L1987_63934 [Smallanthus sonchifolius]